MRILVWSVVAAWAPLAAQTAPYPMQPLRPANQSITGAFEGWFKNSDGTFSLLLGYFNRNTREELDIPVGPANRIDPGGPDRGQPTHFLPGRKWGVFTITVPATFGSSRLTWTLTANGKTTQIPLSLNPLWEVSPFKEEGMGNTPPFLSFDKEDRAVQGPKPMVISLTALVMQPVPLTVFVSDDAKSTPGVEPPHTPAVTLTWTQMRGPSAVLFSNVHPLVKATGWNRRAAFSGTASITATFVQPGDYWLHITANDWSGDGGRGFQCCWTNGEVRVSVRKP